FDVAVVELLQEATESDRTAAKAIRGSLRIIIVLQCFEVDGWFGWIRRGLWTVPGEPATGRGRRQLRLRG
ncbi:MAG: hypothetical protein JWN19_3113, partial [Arthrobacter sp.]|nr:hypothetical protein [Arthrobacter sp.]